jgi:hypothetical protein
MRKFVDEHAIDGGRARMGRVGAALLACVLMLVCTSISAQAATTYSYSSSVGTAGSGSGEFSSPSRVAVDRATGNILVTDTGNNRVEIFSPGSPPAYLTEFGGGSLSAPVGIAIDQSNGDVYVADSGNNRIARFVSDGLPVPTYTLDVTYTSPAQSLAPGASAAAGTVGSFASAIANDPRNGDLLIADAANQRVTRFDSNGQFVRQFDGSDTPSHTFHNLVDIAVDNQGSAYVVDASSLPQDFGDSTIFTFDSSGALQPSLSPTVPTPRSVTHDPTTDNVVVAGNSSFFNDPNGQRLYVFRAGVPVKDFDMPASAGRDAVVGLAIDPRPAGQLITLRQPNFVFGGDPGLDVFDPVILPDLSLGAPTNVTTSAADVPGTVDPLGLPTDYHFEWGVDGQALDPEPAVTGITSPASPTLHLTGLGANQRYRVRLVATNANGTLSSNDVTFTTVQAPPDVVARDASDRTGSSATLRAAVNPFGFQTTYHFEYGTTADYGSRAPATYDSTAGNGHALREVANGVSGLAAGTTYHYRLVAKNQVGTTYGPDRTFVTTGTQAARRYELVSPTDKGGFDVGASEGFDASPDGNSVAYSGQSPLAGSVRTEGAPKYPRYEAHRGGLGWATTPLDPPRLGTDPSTPVYWTTLAVSDDGSESLGISMVKLADGAVEGQSNIYMKDTRTGAYTTIGTSPDSSFQSASVNYAGNLAFYAGTSDFSHVLFSDLGGSGFLPGAPPYALYEWSNGTLKIASVLPDGTDALGVPIGILDRAPHRISEDGSRVFFNGPDGAVYLREGGSTVAVSASEQTGNVGVPMPAELVGASPTGGAAYITATDLTDDSPAGAFSVYAFDAARSTLTRMVSAATPISVFGVGDDDYVYFQTTEALTPDAPSGGGLYVWKDGHLTFASPIATGIGSWQTSQKGEAFAFVSTDRLTSYDNSTGCSGGCSEVYVYDAPARTLACASCRPDGNPPTGNASIGLGVAGEFSHHFPRSVLDDGRVYFDTPDPLSATDVNGVSDVYEYDGGQPVLVSAGNSDRPSSFGDVSASGQDVFFVTKDRLVTTDTDDAADLYDARVDGGFAAQNPAPAQPACGGDDCRGPIAGPTTSPSAPSQGGGARAPKTTPAVKPRVKLATAVFEGTVLHLTVSVSGSGRIRVSGKVLTATTKTVTKAGLYRLKVPLTKKQAAARRKGHRIRASVKVGFTPAFGRIASVKFTRTAAR